MKCFCPNGVHFLWRLALREWGHLMTARVSMMLKSRASVTCFRACVVTCPSVYVYDLLCAYGTWGRFSYLNFDILFGKRCQGVQISVEIDTVPACIVAWFSRVTCAWLFRYLWRQTFFFCCQKLRVFTLTHCSCSFVVPCDVTRGPLTCSDEISYWTLVIKPTRCTNFSKFVFGIKLYMFRTVPVSIIRSFSLYTQQWYMSYRFADSKLYSEKLLMTDRVTVRNM